MEQEPQSMDSGHAEENEADDMTLVDSSPDFEDLREMSLTSSTRHISGTNNADSASLWPSTTVSPFSSSLVSSSSLAARVMEANPKKRKHHPDCVDEMDQHLNQDWGEDEEKHMIQSSTDLRCKQVRKKIKENHEDHFRRNNERRAELLKQEYERHVKLWIQEHEQRAEHWKQEQERRTEIWTQEQGRRAELWKQEQERRTEIWIQEQEQRAERWRQENARRVELWKKDNERRVELWKQENWRRTELWRQDNKRRTELWRQDNKRRIELWIQDNNE